MNIVVCIKQVPEIALVRVDSSEGVILPEGHGSMNPFDEYAVEEGLRIKEKHGGTVTVLSCGGDSSIACLRDALALGADRAILLTDAAFTGSDGVALGAILAAAVKKIGGVDICLFGKNAVDTDRSVVPGATAGKLGWPQVLFVKKFASVENGAVQAIRMTEDGSDTVTAPLPAVFSVVKEINEPRLPSLKGKMKSKSAPVDKWSATDLSIDPNTVGPNSAVKRVGITPPPARQKGQILAGDPASVAATLYEKLREEKVI